jgi:hypothetical protein
MAPDKGSTDLQQRLCQSIYLFRNNDLQFIRAFDGIACQEVDKGDLGCTGSEFVIIRNSAEDIRMFLVAQGQSSAVARLDLASFDDGLAITSGSTDNIELLHEAMSEPGEDQDVWMPVFQARRKARHQKTKRVEEDRDEKVAYSAVRTVFLDRR